MPGEVNVILIDCLGRSGAFGNRLDEVAERIGVPVEHICWRYLYCDTRFISMPPGDLLREIQMRTRLPKKLFRLDAVVVALPPNPILSVYLVESLRVATGRAPLVLDTFVRPDFVDLNGVLDFQELAVK